MDTQTTRLLFLVLFIFATLKSVQSLAITIKQDDHKIEFYDGVSVQLPANDTRKLMSLEINTNKSEETVSKNRELELHLPTPNKIHQQPPIGRAKNKKIMQKFMPMFILPFVIQSTIVPLFLGLLKFMLFKSLMIGKLALVLIIINAFRNSNSFKGRHDEDIANIHYGYHGNGNEEYGSLFNN